MPARREMRGPSQASVNYVRNLASAASGYRRARAATTIQSTWRRRRSKPSRLYSGKSTYRRTSRVANTVMKNISESKYQGAREDCLTTVAKPAGTIRPMSYIFVNTGTSLAASLPEFATPLNLFTFPQGTGQDERVGNYMYIRKSHMKINVMADSIAATDALPDDINLNSPLECRLMVVKANRKGDKLFTSPDPGGSLFINTQNDGFGYDETSGSINLLQSQPINKRQWLVYRDYRFVLSPPTVESETYKSQYGHAKGYPCKRHFAFDLPIMKKTHFENVNNVPDDVDSQWLIILQASRLNNCFQSGPSAYRPTNLKMDILGTTSAYDN